ncbi:MAG: SIS domain-containing protein, partial [Candidatus Altiarchaeales archaeon]|nr:SIS domain-containing protein [Candidatus Altiarchaeales archaeon]
MPLKTAMDEIVKHVAECIDKLDDGEIDEMVKAVNEADRIFVVGAGRSGMAASAFAMRMVQLGLTAYVIGESVTPAMTKNDLLIAVSGSGETKSIVSATEIAKNEVGSKTLAITSYPN